MKVSVGTIVRTIVLIVALVNQFLSATGNPVIPIESAELESLLTAGITMVASVIAWWKNNSFTKPALKADEILKQIKIFYRKSLENYTEGEEING